MQAWIDLHRTRVRIPSQSHWLWLRVTGNSLMAKKSDLKCKPNFELVGLDPDLEIFKSKPNRTSLSRTSAGRTNVGSSCLRSAGESEVTHPPTHSGGARWQVRERDSSSSPPMIINTLSSLAPSDSDPPLRFLSLFRSLALRNGLRRHSPGDGESPSRHLRGRRRGVPRKVIYLSLISCSDPFLIADAVDLTVSWSFQFFDRMYAYLTSSVNC